MEAPTPQRDNKLKGSIGAALSFLVAGSVIVYVIYTLCTL